MSREERDPRYRTDAPMGKAEAISESTIPQAGAVPFRLGHDGKLQVLLITNSQDMWIVPKGGIDPGNTARQTAHIECMEEAGVRGVLVTGELGHYEYHKNDSDHRVTLYALRVTEILPSWPEYKRRKRAWFDLNQAVTIAAFPELAKLIGKVKTHVG